MITSHKVIRRTVTCHKKKSRDNSYTLRIAMCFVYVFAVENLRNDIA